MQYYFQYVDTLQLKMVLYCTYRETHTEVTKGNGIHNYGTCPLRGVGMGHAIYICTYNMTDPKTFRCYLSQEQHITPRMHTLALNVQWQQSTPTWSLQQERTFLLSGPPAL